VLFMTQVVPAGRFSTGLKTSMNTDALKQMPVKTDCVVIGGGIAGVMTAYYLARKGIAVVLCEKGRIAGEQSSRNWGWVRVQGRDTREVPLAVHAQNLWRELAALTGAEKIGFSQCGTTYLTSKPKTLEAYAKWAADTAAMRPEGFECNIIDATAARNILHSNSSPAIGGITTASDCRAEPALAVPAFAVQAQLAGAQILTQCAVRGFETTAGKISAVITENGPIKTSTAVLAGGVWSSLFCRSMGIRLPQLKVVATVCRTEPAPLVTENCVFTETGAFRRRQDGGYTLTAAGSDTFPLVPDALRFLTDFWPLVKSEVFGGHMGVRLDKRFFQELVHLRSWQLDEISPFEKTRVLDPEPSAAHVRKSLKMAEALSPAFGKLTLAESWAGMIDVTPDVLPVLDHIEPLPGLYMATGFSGHGFGIGPATGHVMADLVMGNTPAVDLTPFRFSRFSDGTPIEAQQHL